MKMLAFFMTKADIYHRNNGSGSSGSKEQALTQYLCIGELLGTARRQALHVDICQAWQLSCRQVLQPVHSHRLRARSIGSQCWVPKHVKYEFACRHSTQIDSALLHCVGKE